MVFSDPPNFPCEACQKRRPEHETELMSEVVIDREGYEETREGRVRLTVRYCLEDENCKALAADMLEAKVKDVAERTEPRY